MYAFQLSRKMFFTSCLCFAALEGKLMNGFWIRAPSALDAHASATTQVRSDTITALDQAADGGCTGKGRRDEESPAAWSAALYAAGTQLQIYCHAATCFSSRAHRSRL